LAHVGDFWPEAKHRVFLSTFDFLKGYRGAARPKKEEKWLKIAFFDPAKKLPVCTARLGCWNDVRFSYFCHSSF
jgi:hypothetical protein